MSVEEVDRVVASLAGEVAVAVANHGQAGVFAPPTGAAELGERVRRAATELAVVIQGQIEQGIADRAWSGYRHAFAGNATRAEQTAADTHFDSPQMRLAAGGRAPARSGPRTVEP